MKKKDLKGAHKKPAGGSSIAAAVKKMKDLQNFEEEQSEHDEPESECDEKEGDDRRDKGKGEKFAAMVKAKSLPSHIQYLYDEVAKTKSSPRSFRTLIVNTLFERLPSGRYELRDHKPTFVEAKQLYEKKYCKDAAVALPRLVMRGMYFNGSQLAACWILAFVLGDSSSLISVACSSLAPNP